MHTRLLVSALLFLVLTRNLSIAGAIGERRGPSRRGRQGSDGPSLANAPRMSGIHFPEPQDSLPSADLIVNTQHEGRDSTTRGSPGSPAYVNQTPSPEVRPLLDEAKLIEFEANGEKTERRPTTEKSPNEEPSERPDAPAAANSNWSQLSDILSEILNATGDLAEDSTPRPVTVVSVPQPSSGTAHADNDFDKFLPHLQEALLTALQKEGAEKNPPPTTTRRPSTPPNSAEELFKDILPALEEQIGSILEKSKNDHSVPSSLPIQPPASTPSLPTLPTSSEFDEFIPELERVFSHIVRSSESHPDNQLGRGVKRPSTAEKPLPPGRGGRSNASTETSSIPTEDFILALESSLADILKHETSPPPVSMHRPAVTQDNLVIPQPKIIRVLEKYYPKLMKVLEEIVREEEALSAGTPPAPQSS